MIETFLTIFPLSLAASISVSSTLVFFTIMASKDKQRKNGLAFIAGGILTTTLITLIVLFSFSKAVPVTAPKHSVINGITDFILAGVCVLLLVKSVFKKDRTDKKIDSKRPVSTFEIVGAGAFMRADTAPPFIAAVKDVSVAHLSVESSAIFCALNILIAMSPLIITWLLFMFNKEKALAIINPVIGFLEKNKKKISDTVLVMVAIYLAMHGVKHLGLL
jgi:hypothetical protein